LQGNSCSIDQKSGGIWTVQTDLQQIHPKSGRLLISAQSAEKSTVALEAGQVTEQFMTFSSAWQYRALSAQLQNNIHIPEVF
jgi:hypothetical protein